MVKFYDAKSMAINWALSTIRLVELAVSQSLILNESEMSIYNLPHFFYTVNTGNKFIFSDEYIKTLLQFFPF